MKIGAAYVRVSTDDQLEFSPDAQKRAIRDYAKRNDILLDDNYIFIDEGISGRRAERRPAFMRMIATAKQKPSPFEVILVHKFDRFARNREDSVVYKSLLRKECGVKVISITEQIEDDKFSIILESMLEAMAEYYSLNLSDEVKKGMFEKARRGEHIGKPPYGYDLENKTLVINKYESAIIKKIYNLYLNENKSLTAVSRYLNENNVTTKRGGKWRNCTVKYILENHVYTGVTRYNYISPNGFTPNPQEEWIIAQGSHPSIISSEDHIAACKKLKVNESLSFQTSKAQNINSWLYQLVYCKECGVRLTLHSYNRGKYYAFECVSSQEGRCSQHGSLSTRKSEAFVLDVIARDIQIPETFHFEVVSSAENQMDLAILKIQLKRVAEKRRLAKKAYFAEVDTLEDYKENKKLFDEEETDLNKKIRELQKPPLLKEKEKQKYINMVKDYLAILTNSELSMEERNGVAKQFISKITLNLTDKTFQVYYYI